MKVIFPSTYLIILLLITAANSACLVPTTDLEGLTGCEYLLAIWKIKSVIKRPSVTTEEVKKNEVLTLKNIPRGERLTVQNIGWNEWMICSSLARSWREVDIWLLDSVERYHARGEEAWQISQVLTVIAASPMGRLAGLRQEGPLQDVHYGCCCCYWIWGMPCTASAVIALFLQSEWNGVCGDVERRHWETYMNV